MDIRLDQLRVLDAIERTGTFAKAAAELFRVPSAVSYAVRTLEQEAGFPLFERSGRRAVFTPAGRRFLEEGRRLLAAAGSFESVADQLRTGWESELHVVVDGALPLGPILQSLRVFADPEIPTRFRLDVELKEGVVHRFNAESADLMLLIGFDPGEDTSAYDLQPLDPLELVLVSRDGVPTEGDSALELSVRDSSPSSPQQSRSYSGARDVAYVPDFHAKRVALLAEVGFGWMPVHMVADDLARGHLVEVEAELSRWTYHPQVAWRAGTELGRGARLFLSLLSDGDTRP